MSNDEFYKAGLDHPCRETCSGWKQGRERGIFDTKEEFISFLEYIIFKISHTADRQLVTDFIKKLKEGK